MRALFVANLQLKSTEGIYKKVCSQADAIGDIVGNCDLVMRFGSNAVVKKYGANVVEEKKEKFYKYVMKILDNDEIKLVYIRHMIPDFRLIKILSKAKKKSIKIYYEIPTYPYFGEQFKAAKKKYKAMVKISLDIIFWPWIYCLIDKLVVIRSNTKKHHFSKMVEITNGVKTDDIVSKTYPTDSNNDKFSMITVGTLYPYHGYDRVLHGLADCNESVDGKVVEFHVVGQSDTIDELHKLSDELNLKHVVFHGVKTTEELNKMYEEFDVGLGGLALHRRNADIDTTLKVIEYYCRGVPVVTSGLCPSTVVRPFTICVEDSENPLNIEYIYNSFCEINNKESISKVSKDIFSWTYIMKELMGN